MGNPIPVTDGGGGGGGGGGSDALLQSILDTLLRIQVAEWGVFIPGGSLANTDFMTGGTSPFQAYSNPKPVKKAIIQNLSPTDTLTIVFVSASAGKVAPIVAGDGITLNPAPSADQGGGSLPVGNVDLSSMTLVFSTNATQEFVVYYEY